MSINTNNTAYPISAYDLTHMACNQFEQLEALSKALILKVSLLMINQ